MKGRMLVVRERERSVGYLRAVDRNGKGILIGVLGRTKDMMRSNMQGKRRPWVWKDRQRHANEEDIRRKTRLNAARCLAEGDHMPENAVEMQCR